MAVAGVPGGGVPGGGVPGGGVLPAAPAARVERATSDINVPSFDSLSDDFEEWVELFEKAVMLATNVRDDDSLHFLYKEWLPLKLDSSARAMFKQVAGRAWPELKAQLILLLVDPQEQARWQAKKITIKWDGKESFHNLASRVKRAVDKYERGMPDDFKAREYYQRFKNAFKKPMRKAIAYGCPEGARTIEEAKAVALRYHIASTEDDDNGDSAANDGKSMVFAAGSFHPDRATGIENSLARITTQLENISVSLRGYEARFRSIEDRLTALECRGGYQDRDDYDDWDNYQDHNDDWDDYRDHDDDWDDYQDNDDDWDDYEDRDWPESQEQEDYHGLYPPRDSDGGRRPGQHGDPLQFRRHSHGLPKKQKNGQPSDGEYSAVNTGNRCKGDSDKCQYKTASSRVQGGKDTRSSRK